MMISIVVPCYNEEEALPHFKAAFDAVSAEMPDAGFELLLVDDGSSDGTLALANRMAEEDSRVRVLSFSRNFGKEAALLAGLTHATGDLVAVMDADLQDPPSLLPTMYAMILETGCDCVATRRVTRAGEPPVRSFFARTFYKLMNAVSTVPIVDGARDFRLMKRPMVDAILLLTERRRFSKGLFAWVGFDVRYLEYENVERVAGVTKWSFWGLLRYALEGVFSMTTAPLSLPIVLGFFCVLATIVFMILGLWVAAALSVVSALVLFGVGITGLYIARIYWETTKRPLYIVKEENGPGC